MVTYKLIKVRNMVLSTYTTQWGELRRCPLPHCSWPVWSTRPSPLSSLLELAGSQAGRLGERFDDCCCYPCLVHCSQSWLDPVEFHLRSIEEYWGKGDPECQRWWLHQIPLWQCSFGVNESPEELYGRDIKAWVITKVCRHPARGTKTQIIWYLYK